MKVFNSYLLLLFLFTTSEFFIEGSSYQPLINNRTKLLNSNELKKGEEESGNRLGSLVINIVLAAEFRQK